MVAILVEERLAIVIRRGDGVRLAELRRLVL
jgi:hypothetical protein